MAGLSHFVAAQSLYSTKKLTYYLHIAWQVVNGNYATLQKGETSVFLWAQDILTL